VAFSSCEPSLETPTTYVHPLPRSHSRGDALNIPTIFAIQGGLLLVAAITMYVNWRMNRSLPETEFGALAFAWMVVAAFLLSGFWGSPEASTVLGRLLIIVGNVLYTLSFVLFKAGARCVTDRSPLHLSQILWIIATLGVAQAIGDFGTDHGAILRPAISTTGLTLISASTVWVVFSTTDRMTAPRGLFAVFSIMAAVALALRSVLLIMSDFGWTFSELLQDALLFYALTLMISGYTVECILLTVHALNVQLRD